MPGSSSQAARPHILPRLYLYNYTALPLSFPSSSIFPPLPLSFPLFPPNSLRFSFYLTLLFFLHLCTSSSISPCLSFSISNPFQHLSFSILLPLLPQPTGALHLCFSSFNVLFFLCLYLSSYVIYPPSFCSLPCFSFIYSISIYFPFPLPLWSTIHSSVSSPVLYFLLFQFSLSLLLFPLSSTSLFN